MNYFLYIICITCLLSIALNIYLAWMLINTPERKRAKQLKRQRKTFEQKYFEGWNDTIPR